MDTSLIVTIYYYDGQFYIPTTVRSLEGMTGVIGPIVMTPVGNRNAFIEEVETKAIEGNPVLSRAEFREQSNQILLSAMHLSTLHAFFTQTHRWSIIEHEGAYTLIPYKAAPFRGVMEAPERAVSLNPASFAYEAYDIIRREIDQA